MVSRVRESFEDLHCPARTNARVHERVERIGDALEVDTEGLERRRKVFAAPSLSSNAEYMLVEELAARWEEEVVHADGVVDDGYRAEC
jgi:hypothetical protein